MSNTALKRNLGFLIFPLTLLVTFGATLPTNADPNDYNWVNLSIESSTVFDYPQGFAQDPNGQLNSVTDSATCKSKCANSQNCQAFWFAKGTRHALNDQGTTTDINYSQCFLYTTLPAPVTWYSGSDNVDYTDRVFQQRGPLKACIDPNSFKVGGSSLTSSQERGVAYTGIGYLLGYLNSPQDCAFEILQSGGNAWVWIYYNGIDTLKTGYCFGSSTGKDSGSQFTLKNSPAVAVFPTTQGQCTANDNECTQSSMDSYPTKKCCVRGRFFQCSQSK
ncbi:hypothetical protein EHO61_09805 [Leptospira fluminis]|uniref:Apple domain-containing protein n=1 Tax=Leptospira fluminis TaxID=2484979 RepID=A0A4R9GP85_9LEPT|nr:hypothetical protein [Leptospira fluminis]TGK18743.1 hypothetical protein EHO61_09805 [Leptospira fluminis]